MSANKNCENFVNCQKIYVKLDFMLNKAYILCMEKYELNEIERSIIKRHAFRKKLFSRFTKAVVEYRLVEPYDRIAVCLSGGKDSMLMAMLFKELDRQQKFPFKLEFIAMDPGYSKPNRELLEENAAACGIALNIFETRIFDAVDRIEKSPCYLCARMRRGYLYKKAQDLGCNKIALGHHYDDVIETILMSMLWAGQLQTMMPRLKSQNFEGMELIRPMYYVREDDIKEWAEYNGLHFLRCACHFTENCSSLREDGSAVSKRIETKKLIKELMKKNPYTEANIFKTVQNVNIDMIPSYKKDGVIHHFLEDY